MTLGKGFVSSYSLKQKMNVRSSNESELIGVDDVVAKIIWTQKILKGKDLKSKTILYFATIRVP